MATPMRGLLGALLGLIAAASSIAPAHAQLHPDPDDEVLLEARIGGLQIGNGVRGYTTAAGLCLDFHDAVTALQVAIEVDPDGSAARGWAFDESRRIDIDRKAGQARFGNQYAKLQPTTIWESKAGWCVLAGDLGKWLGVDFEPDVTNALLTISAKGSLPIEAAMRRAASAYRLEHSRKAEPSALPRVTMPYRAWRAPSIDVTAALSASRDAHAAPGYAANYEVFAAGELGYLSADARLSSNDHGAPQSLRLKLYRVDSDRRLLGPIRASELAVGDVFSPSTGLISLATPGRGLTVTNRPLGIGSRYDQVNFAGALPQGWDAELYRNGELLRSVSGGGTGRYEFSDVDLLFGVNRFETVLYGPQGQVRRERHAYNIAAQAPEPGKLWWYAAMLQSRRDLIEFSRPRIAAGPQGWRADLGLEYGLGKGISVALGAHRLPTLRAGPQSFGEVAARASVFGFLAELSAAADQNRGIAYRASVLGELFDTSIALEAIRNRGLSSERIAAQQTGLTAVALDRPVHLGGLILPVHFDLRSVTTTGDASLQAQSRVSIATRKLSVSASFGWRRVTPNGGAAHTSATGSILMSGRLGATRVRGGLDWEIAPTPRLTGATISANRQIGDQGDAQASLGYAAGDKYAYGAIGYSRDLGFASVTGNAQADTRGAFALKLGLGFSFGGGGHGRFGRIGSTPRASTGSLEVSAYQDLNGDGARQVEEPWIPVPGLLVNDVPVPLCKKRQQPCAAIAHLDGIEPFVPVRLAIDESAIADPFELPSSAGVAAVPRSGLTTRVELGIVGTATIEGTLLVNGKPAPAQRLVLVDKGGGVAYRVSTEFDGYFSVERVRYGDYRLRLENGSETLGVISVNAEHNSVRLGSLATALIASSHGQ